MSKEPDNLVWLHQFKKSVLFLIRQSLGNNEKIVGIGMTEPLFKRYQDATNGATSIWGYRIKLMEYSDENPNDEQVAILGHLLN